MILKSNWMPRKLKFHFWTFSILWFLHLIFLVQSDKSWQLVGHSPHGRERCVKYIWAPVTRWIFWSMAYLFRPPTTASFLVSHSLLRSWKNFLKEGVVLKSSGSTRNWRPKIVNDPTFQNMVWTQHFKYDWLNEIPSINQVALALSLSLSEPSKQAVDTFYKNLIEVVNSYWGYLENSVQIRGESAYSTKIISWFQFNPCPSGRPRI